MKSSTPECSPEISPGSLPLEELAVNKLNPRTITREGSFLIPYLTTGMKLLDAGCGNGSLAHGFANYIHPGQVVGIDNSATQISMANDSLIGTDINNLEFRVADLYELPFANDTFDVVFAHNVFIHLTSPHNALKELHRVCRKGGIIGLRDGLANHGYYSAFPLRQRFSGLSQFINESARLSDGSPDVGIKLKGLLNATGFTHVDIKVQSEVYDKSEDMQMLKSWYSGLLGGWIGELAITEGLINYQELMQLLKSIEDWDKDPAAINVITWIEHIAKK